MDDIAQPLFIKNYTIISGYFKKKMPVSIDDTGIPLNNLN